MLLLRVAVSVSEAIKTLHVLDFVGIKLHLKGFECCHVGESAALVHGVVSRLSLL